MLFLANNLILIRDAVLRRMVDEIKFDPLFHVLAAATRMRVSDAAFVLLLGCFDGDELWFGIKRVLQPAVSVGVHSLLTNRLHLFYFKRHSVCQVIEELDFILSFRRQLLDLLLFVLFVAVLALSVHRVHIRFIHVHIVDALLFE